MRQATRKAAELIKLVTYCNNVNAYCASLSCTPTHTHTHTHTRTTKIEEETKHCRIVQK